jgi:transposase, IS30 family
MKDTYTHITQAQRYTLSAELQANKPKSAIANDLGKHRSTLWPERKRNSNPETARYNPVHAHNKAQDRRKPKLNKKRKPKPNRLTDFAFAYIVHQLRQQWSPEQISGALSAHGWLDVLCHEWIYQFIYSEQGRLLNLKTYLRCQKTYRKRGYKTRDRRGQLHKGTSIHDRPAMIETLSRVGDLEGDTIIGKNHKGAALTLVDRRSLHVWTTPMAHRYALTTAKACIAALALCKPRSITFDNGKAFAAHDLIAQQTGADVYFADAYQSNQRARNENTNGLIHQYLPKSRRLDNVSKAYVEKMMYKLNNRPRKVLNWLTPAQVWAGY